MEASYELKPRWNETELHSIRDLKKRKSLGNIS